MRKKILILGGGISGLSAGWKLSEKGFPVEVMEIKDEVGGLAHTVKKEGRFFDYGPHYFFSENSKLLNEVKSLFREEFGEDMIQLERNVKLMFKGKFLKYPLDIKNILLEIPLYESFLIGVSYLITQFIESTKKAFHKETPDYNFEIWAKKNFGSYLYRIFFKPYTENYWGISCKKLSPASLPTHTKLSFFKTLKLIFNRSESEKNLSLAERETTLPLNYPKKGIGMISDAMALRIKKHKGKIHTGYAVKEIKRADNGKFIVTAETKGKTKKFNADFVISTIPLPFMVPMLRPSAPADVLESLKKLNFLSLVVLYVVIPKREILNCGYLYFVGRPYNRVSDASKFSPYLCRPDENMAAIEISCHTIDPVWRYNQKQLFEHCIKHLEKDHLIKRKEVKKIFSLRARCAYPIFLCGYENQLQKTLDFINSIPNFKVLGRVGSFRYIDLDHSVGQAFELVDKILPELNKKPKIRK